MDRKEKVWIIVIILLGINFLVRLLDQAKMMLYFALDYHNDVSSYMAQLSFLKTCGFHKLCPYWYNGFTSFKFSPPGWYFFTYPIYLITNDVKTATYFSMVLIFVLVFIAVYYFGRLAGLSKVKRIVFFFLFFANASAVGNFIRLGRVNELLSWFLFVILFFMFYYYRNKKIDKYFYVVIPVYAALILAYHSTGVLAAVLWCGFLLTRKSGKEWLKVIGGGIASLLLSSFWLFPFVRSIFTESAIPHLKQGEWVWYFGANNLFTNVAVFVIPLAALILFYLYGKTAKKEDFLLFMPSMVLAVFFFLRLTPFLPIFNQIFPDPVFHYLLFFAIFFLLKIELKNWKREWRMLLYVGVIAMVIGSVAVNTFHTPLYEKPESVVEKEFISYIPLLKERFVLVGTYPDGPFPKAFYSFAASEGVSSISGWYPEEKEYAYIQRMEVVHTAFREKRCEDFKNELRYFNTTEVLARDEFCVQLEECGLKEVTKQSRTCVYHL